MTSISGYVIISCRSIYRSVFFGGYLEGTPRGTPAFFGPPILRHAHIIYSVTDVSYVCSSIT